MLTRLRNPNSLSRAIARRLPTLHAGVFHALNTLMPDELGRSDLLVSRIEGAPDLYLRVLERHNYTTFLQLTYVLGPEREQHPNAHIRVYHDARMAEATSFSPEQGIERLAGPDLPVRGLVERSWRMNRALLKWLEYLIAEGHSAATMKASEDMPDLPEPEPMPPETADESVRVE
ncbi:MAG: DUF1249 domain-containing protein [Wenzhouxiangellaceae bacterium]|nr:DUF1249 domain-containing protein [Wenzhouxiangellaceae bacterium]